MSESDTGTWPSLPLEAWQETYRTLHMWSQIVGKVRLALAPLTNHWWNVGAELAKWDRPALERRGSA